MLKVLHVYCYLLHKSILYMIYIKKDTLYMKNMLLSIVFLNLCITFAMWLRNQYDN